MHWNFANAFAYIWERGPNTQQEALGLREKGTWEWMAEWYGGTENIKRKSEYTESRWRREKEEMGRTVLENRMKNIRDPLTPSWISHSFSSHDHIYVPWVYISSLADWTFVIATKHTCCLPSKLWPYRVSPGSLFPWQRYCFSSKTWVRFCTLSTLPLYLRTLNGLDPWILDFWSPHRRL